MLKKRKQNKNEIIENPAVSKATAKSVITIVITIPVPFDTAGFSMISFFEPFSLCQTLSEELYLAISGNY